jgi:hypothetical protein
MRRDGGRTRRAPVGDGTYLWKMAFFKKKYGFEFRDNFSWMSGWIFTHAHPKRKGKKKSIT